MSTVFKKVWKDIAHKKGRSLLTIVTISFCVVGVSLFAVKPLADKAINDQVKQENYHNIGIAISDTEINEDDMRFIADIDGVEEVTYRTIFKTKYSNEGRKKDIVLIGVDDFNNQSVDKVVINSGRVPSELEVITDSNNIKKSFLEKEENESVKIFDINGEERELTISGVGRSIKGIQYGSDGAVVMYTGTNSVRLLAGYKGYNEISLTVTEDSDKALKQITENLREYLYTKDEGTVFTSMPEYWRNDEWKGKEVFDGITSLVVIFSVVIFICSILLITSSIATIIAEQRKEITQMRAIGGSKRKIIGVYLLSVLILGIVGAFIGIVFGSLLSHLVLGMLVSSVFDFKPDFSLHTPTLIVSFCLGVTVVLVSALPSLLKVLKISIPDGLGKKNSSYSYSGSFIEKALLKIPFLSSLSKMSLRNILREKRRSIMMILQFSLATGIILTVFSLGDAVVLLTKKAYEFHPWDHEVLLVNQDKSINKSDINALQDIDDIQGVEPFIQQEANVNGTTIYVLGLVWDTFGLDKEYTLNENGSGRWWSKEEDDAGENVLLVGKPLADKYGIEIGDTLLVELASGQSEFEVIGINYNVFFNGQMVVMPLSTMQKNSGQDSFISGVYLKNTDAENIDTVKQSAIDIENYLDKKGIPYTLTVKYQAMDKSINDNSSLSIIFFIVSIIVVLVCLVGLMSALVVNVLNRTKEIGILRSIGATSLHIRKIFSLEALFLVIIGWVIGIPLGYLMLSILNYLIEDVIHFPFRSFSELKMIYMPVSFILIVILTFIVIWFPIRKAVKIKTGEALRYE